SSRAAVALRGAAADRPAPRPGAPEPAGSRPTQPHPPGAGGKVALSFSEISARLRGLPLPEVDVVVGIATGGVVPAALLAHQLGVPLALLRVNYRAEDNTPQRPAPALLAPPPPLGAARRVLLVDDVSVSGATLAAARAALPGRAVPTLALKGRADLVAFPEVASCVAWPWRA